MLVSLAFEFAQAEVLLFVSEAGTLVGPCNPNVRVPRFHDMPWELTKGIATNPLNSKPLSCDGPIFTIGAALYQ